jgi:hypothetical protein
MGEGGEVEGPLGQTPFALGGHLAGEIEPAILGQLVGGNLFGLADADATPGAVSLTGSIAVLNQYLASGGLRYTGPGEALTVRLASATRSVEGAVALQAAASAQSLPLTLPATVPETAGEKELVLWMEGLVRELLQGLR